MKAQSKGLFCPSKEKKETYTWAKNVIHTGHKFGTIVKNRNIKHVENKKKLLGTLNAYK